MHATMLLLAHQLKPLGDEVLHIGVERLRSDVLPLFDDVLLLLQVVQANPGLLGGNLILKHH